MHRSTASSAGFLRLVCCLAFGLLPAPGHAADPTPSLPKLLDAFVARPLGPANMGGRVVDLAVVENKPTTLYVATASGGLWKTVNNGTTWTPLFDEQTTASLGAVAVAPSNPDIVWVGTGEANARNSVSWGDGVYKSTDGGQTWRHTGLRDTAHIGRIVVHPQNPDIVYVAALGHLWGPNRERGLSRTVDGGQTWQQVKFLNEETGFIDLALDPNTPTTLYAAAYRCRRDRFAGGNPREQFGSHAGLYKSVDAGETWIKLTSGLPERPLGRCGLAIYRKDPRILYAVIQTDKTEIRTVAGQAAKTNDQVDSGGIFRSDDRGQTWSKLNDLCPRPFYFGQIRIDPNDAQRIYVLGITLHISQDGGKTFRNRGAPGVHADHHALWIDPHDSDHLVLGGDGGLSFSYDRGAQWEHLRNLPIGQFYAVGVDLRKPYRVYGGLQDNGTWGGPSATRNPDGITVADWFRVLGADGFACQVDPTNPDVVYAESQYGRLQRIDVRTGRATAVISPRAPPNRPPYRFNWNTPLLLSAHNPPMVYYGGNHLFRSLDRGDHWEVISPDLTRGQSGPNPDWGHTLTAIAESPLRAGVLYIGTDDGRVQMTRDGGAVWTDLSGRIPGVPADGWITRIECSRFDEGTAYLSLDRHRQDDRAPYLFKTTDCGVTWKPLTNQLPREGPIHVVREDLDNRNLLFVGTEFGLFATLDGGATWHRLRAGLPTVAVHDLVIHPRDRELVIATHGRSIYVLDIAPLEQLTPEILRAKAHLFSVKPATVYEPHGSRGRAAAKSFVAPNPPYGATLCYYLRDTLVEPVQITITDALGTAIAELKGEKEAGLHWATWGLRRKASTSGDDPESKAQDEPVAPGDYIAELHVGDQIRRRRIQVEAEE